MTVRDTINQEMIRLSKDPKVLFLGENVINSGRIYGTLNDVPLKQCIEMPIAENLIAGIAIGLSIAGFIPVCIFQRMDFMLIAADQIINHACMYPCFGVPVKVIFRTIKASLNDKFYVGLQHSKDLSYVFERNLPTIQVPGVSAKTAYKHSLLHVGSTLVVEDYSRFNEPAIG